MSYRTVFNCINEPKRILEVDRFKDKVYIVVQHGDEYQEFYMDISTAIKLSKTLRTEINKAKEVENA